ncbi:hypothetical protein BTJ44_01039 [Bacillus mycoides]|nr:hypothetical protein BTJ44_01039 [Bacillus mycoides]
MSISIDENSIISSGSLVTKDTPATVAAGVNPCRVIKTID